MRQRLVSVACIAALVAPVAATVRQRRFGRRQGEGKMRAAFTTLLTSLLLIPALAVAQNTPPVADAGPDQSVFLGTPVLLQGDAYDADGNAIVSWLWSIESAPTGSTATIDFPYFQATDFYPDVPGDYVFSLVVSDGIDTSLPDTVLVSVTEILPPVARATGQPLVGVVPLVVNFDGSQSEDSVGGGLTYGWNFGDGSLPSTEVSPTHLFELPGTFTASLTVIDSYGQSDTDTVVIDVLPATNTPPVADAGPDQSIQVYSMTLLQGSGTDAENDPIVGWAWAVESSPAGSTPVLGNPTADHTTFVADVVGDYVISLVVSDGLDFSEPDFVTVTVFDILPPVAVATADVTSGPAPLTVHFDGSGSTVDPDVGGTLLYEWSFDDGTLSSEVSPTHTYGLAGKYVATLTVLDARGQLDTAHIVITVGRFVVLGERVLVKADARKGRRKVIAVARDAATDLPAGPTGAGLPLVDDPVMNGGAALDVRVYAGDGGAPSTAQYDLLGVDDASTGYGWKRTGDGYVYRDGRGTQGPVRRLVVRRTASGIFVLRAVMTGYAPNDPRTPTVPTVPPNPGTAAGLMLTFGVGSSGGSTYCLLWGNEAGGTIKRNDDALLKIVRPTAVAAACPLPGIVNGNTPPVADAGPDQSVPVGVSTTLAGSATDAENDAIVSWLWTVESSPSGSTPVLGTPTEPTTTFVADVVGTYVVSLVVSDGLDASAPDLVTIEVVAAGP